mgnify:CR=1 FL=1
MTASELIEAITLASDKNSLESLVASKPEIVIDKRKSLETLKAQVLDALQGQTDNIHQLAVLPALSPEAPLVLPTIDDEEDEVGQVTESVTANRLLRNKRTQRVVLWTPALSVLSSFEEI